MTVALSQHCAIMVEGAMLAHPPSVANPYRGGTSVQDSTAAIRLFWEKVNKNGPIPEHSPDLGPCWEWTGAQYFNGYGQVRIQSKALRVHRVAYEWLVGPIPSGLHMDHLCRNRLCCNPDHLEPVTQKENNRRSWAARPRKTHCPRGHEYTPDNIYVNSVGGRHCKTCVKSRDRKRAA